MGAQESLQYSRQYQQHNSNTRLILFTEINASSNRFLLHMKVRTCMRTHYIRWEAGRSRTAGNKNETNTSRVPCKSQNKT